MFFIAYFIMWVLSRRKIAKVNLAEGTETKTVGICLMKNQYQLFSPLDNSKAPESIRIYCKKSTAKIPRSSEAAIGEARYSEGSL